MSVEFQDVWFAYAIARETNENALEDMIACCPQFERDLREAVRIQALIDAAPEREITQEEHDHAVSIGRGVVKGMLTGKRMGWNECCEWAAAWIENSLSGETNERTIEFGRNMAMSIRAAKKQDS